VIDRINLYVSLTCLTNGQSSPRVNSWKGLARVDKGREVSTRVGKDQRGSGTSVNEGREGSTRVGKGGERVCSN
jgi:hypothetical protein